MPAIKFAKLSVFIIAAVCGALFITVTRAATFTRPAEAESGQMSGATALTNDNGASGSQSVLFGGTGNTTTRLYGYSTHILANDTDPQADAYTALAASGGATTVRDDNAFQWKYTETSKGVYDWEASDALITFAANHGLHVLMLTDSIATWSTSADTAGFGDFVGKLASRYGPGGAFWLTNPTVPKVYPAGIEIWNEENVDDTMPPAVLTPLLKSAYASVRRTYASPASMPVVLGGLAPSGAYNDAECTGATNKPIASWGDISPLNYLESVYKAGGGGSFDAVGWHPYNFSDKDTAAYILAYDRCSAWSQMNDTHIQNPATPSVVSLMQQYGDGSKKIWITETGVSTCAPTGTSNYPCVTEAEQAKLATQQVAAWKTYPWAGNFYWYSLRDDFGGNDTADDQAHFGTVRGTLNSTANGGPGSLKPAFTNLKNAYLSP